MNTILCVGRHPVDLADGRTVAPGEQVTDVDMDAQHNQDLEADGHIMIVEPATAAKRVPPPKEENK